MRQHLHATTPLDIAWRCPTRRDVRLATTTAGTCREGGKWWSRIAEPNLRHGNISALTQECHTCRLGVSYGSIMSEPDQPTTARHMPMTFLASSLGPYRRII